MNYIFSVAFMANMLSMTAMLILLSVAGLGHLAVDLTIVQASASTLFYAFSANASIELLVFNFGGKNVILCSLLGQIVANRFASFGYVPMQTYLLIGALFLNLLIIYFSDKFLLLWHNKNLEAGL